MQSITKQNIPISKLICQLIPIPFYHKLKL